MRKNGNDTKTARRQEEKIVFFIFLSEKACISIGTGLQYEFVRKHNE